MAQDGHVFVSVFRAVESNRSTEELICQVLTTRNWKTFNISSHRQKKDYCLVKYQTVSIIQTYNNLLNLDHFNQRFWALIK